MQEKHVSIRQLCVLHRCPTVSSDQDLWNRVGGTLQNGADDLDEIRNAQRELRLEETYNPSHSHPHAQPPSQPLTQDEGKDASREGSKVVDRDNNAFESGVRMPERFDPVAVRNDA